MNERYKTVITIGYFALGAMAVVVVAVIAVFRPDATATIINFVGTTMAIASTGAVTFYMLGKQNEKLDKVEKQTNGQLTALTDENAQLRRQLAAKTINTRRKQP